MARCLCDEADARRLLNPGPIVIVTTEWRGNTNAAPVIWATSLSMEPPLVGLVIHPSRHTADMIRFSEEFALNIPGPSLMRHVAFLGSQTGLNANKIESAGLECFRGLRTEAPLIEDCLAWIECGLEDVQRFGDHSLFVGRVLKVQALDEAYAGFWKLEEPRYSPLTYLGGSKYALVGDEREATFETDEHGALIQETPEEREEREEREARDRELREAEGDEGVEELRSRTSD
jgi:flavin reductase (DIM6/NTAB) family NADH-FMN oxidoreductase RutF